MKTMTRTDQSTASKSDHPVTLLLAFELGDRTWKLGFTALVHGYCALARNRRALAIVTGEGARDPARSSAR